MQSGSDTDRVQTRHLTTLSNVVVVVTEDSPQDHNAGETKIGHSRVSTTTNTPPTSNSDRKDHSIERGLNEPSKPENLKSMTAGATTVQSSADTAADMDAMYTDLFSYDTHFPFSGILTSLDRTEEEELALSPKDSDYVSSTTTPPPTDPWSDQIMSPLDSPNKSYIELSSPCEKLNKDMAVPSPKRYQDLDAKAPPPGSVQPVSQEFSLPLDISGSGEESTYTLTLTDGTIVQLELQNDNEQGPDTTTSSPDGSWLQPQQPQPQDFDTMFQNLLKEEQIYEEVESPKGAVDYSYSLPSPNTPAAKQSELQKKPRLSRKRSAAATVTSQSPQPIRKNPKRSASVRKQAMSSASSVTSGGSSSFEDDFDRYCHKNSY